MGAGASKLSGGCNLREREKEQVVFRVCYLLRGAGG